MKTYRYDIYQKHECFTQETYDVKAATKEEADKLIIEFYKTGDEHSQIEFFSDETDTVWETMVPVQDAIAEIVDEHDNCINQ